MRRVALRHSLGVLVFTLWAGMGSVSSVIAQGETPETLPQEATPQAGGLTFPLESDPALCTVEPRPTDELLDLWFPAGGTPTAVLEEARAEVTIPLGQPADGAIILAVSATVHEIFSCFAAGDYGRAAALFTDDLARQLGPAPGQTREQVTAFLEVPPVLEEEASRVIAITNVMVLEDGRVGAFIVERGVQGDTTAYVIFEYWGTHWLLDEVMEFSPGNE